MIDSNGRQVKVGDRITFPGHNQFTTITVAELDDPVIVTDGGLVLNPLYDRVKVLR